MVGKGKSMRVLVCGGRNFTNAYLLMRVLREYDVTTLIHGMAKGADTLGGEWAESNRIRVERYPADCSRHGLSAGYVRNLEMINHGIPDLVVAFPGGKGTYNMMQLARKKRVKLRKVTTDEVTVPWVMNMRDVGGWSGYHDLFRAGQPVMYVGRLRSAREHYGNPFTHQKATADKLRLVLVGSRFKAIRACGNWLDGKDWSDLETWRRRWILDHISDLKNKDLFCWCAPRPCHAKIYLQKANA